MLVRNTWMQSQDEKGTEIEISPAACCFLDMSALRGSFSPANGCSLSRNNKNLDQKFSQKVWNPFKVLNPPDQQNKRHLYYSPSFRHMFQSQHPSIRLLSFPTTPPCHLHLPYVHLPWNTETFAFSSRIRQWIEYCRYEFISWDSET